MKKIKSFISIMLVAVMALAMSMTAFAAEGDYTITITDSSDGVSMAGNTYSAYKLFDVTYNEGKTAYAYTVAEAFEGFTYQEKSGYDLVEYLEGKGNDSEFMNQFAKAAYQYVVENSISAVKSITAPTGNVTSVKIPLSEAGYYIVYGTATANDGQGQVVAAIGLTTADPNAKVTLKADAPTIDKFIVNADSANGQDGKGTAQDVGSTVQFKLTSTVPKMIGYDEYQYIVHDKMSAGLTFNNDVEVTIGGETYRGFNVETVSPEGVDDTFRIVFDSSAFVTLEEGAEIVITYSATLNEGALTTDVETNEVKLEYSNNPRDGGEGTGETPEKPVYVYDFDIEIDKYVKDDETTKLAEAEFILANEAGDKYYTWNEANKKVVWVNTKEEADTITTDENGAAHFKGIDSGKYQLIETKAPAGYNKLADPIVVEIKVAYNTDGTINTNDTTATNVTVKHDNQYGVTSKVENSTGSLLPSTGGIGTTIFYIVGAILVIGAGIILVAKKRMSHEQ